MRRKKEVKLGTSYNIHFKFFNFFPPYFKIRKNKNIFFLFWLTISQNTHVKSSILIFKLYFI